MGALQAVSPELAAAFAARRFLSPPSRRPDRRSEYAVLLLAERSRLTFEQESLAVHRWGSGPTVLLLHGWGGSTGQMTAFVAPLVAAGFSVLAFDAPAHGASTGNWLAMPRYAAAIQQVAAAFGPIHAVVAHSFGAPAAALAVSRGLRVERAVFLGPPADALAWFSGFSRALGLSDAITLATRRRVEARAGVGFAQLNASVFGPSLGMPLLVVHDRHDREVAWQDGAIVAATAVDARLVTTSGLGHRKILRDAGVLDETVAFVAARPQAQPARVFDFPTAQTDYRTSA